MKDETKTNKRGRKDGRRKEMPTGRYKGYKHCSIL
jgi:hypothetical protein